MKNLVLACCSCNWARNDLSQAPGGEIDTHKQRRAFIEHCHTMRNRIIQKLQWPGITEEVAQFLWEIDWFVAPPQESVCVTVPLGVKSAQQ
jgi:hypothetical protein